MQEELRATRDQVKQSEIALASCLESSRNMVAQDHKDLEQVKSRLIEAENENSRLQSELRTQYEQWQTQDHEIARLIEQNETLNRQVTSMGLIEA